jgi:hypothetical protein
MNTLLIAIVVATAGIDFGWQRLPEGGMLYIIQLSPEALDSLRAGRPIESDVPATAGDVRSYRIVVGRGPLPHDIPPPLPAPSVAARSTVVARSPDRATPADIAARSGDRATTGDRAAPEIIAPNAKPLSGQQANFEEPAGKPAAAKPQPAPVAAPAPQEPAKPWLPLTLTLFGLFGSVGANVYLSWMIVELRRRFRTQFSAGL